MVNFFQGRRSYREFNIGKSLTEGVSDFASNTRTGPATVDARGFAARGKFALFTADSCRRYCVRPIDGLARPYSFRSLDFDREEPFFFFKNLPSLIPTVLRTGLTALSQPFASIGFRGFIVTGEFIATDGLGALRRPRRRSPADCSRA